MKNLFNTQLVICALICGKLFAADKHITIEDNLGTKEPKNALFKLDFKNKYSNPKTQVTNAKLDAFGSSVERSLNNFMVTNQPQVDTEKLELVSYIKLLESQLNHYQLKLVGCDLDWKS